MFIRLLILLAVLLLGGPLSCWAEQDGLRILLTNDDGWDSPGINAVAEALRAAGHDVTVVAPLTQQSGTGMKITLGELAVVEQRPGVWSVAGSPADAVGVGLRHILRDKPPELVVSGANLGQNLGANVTLSGTVGAAMMAVQHGVPAVAVSVGLELAEAAAEPRFESTLAAFPGAAALTARLVANLARKRSGELLPSNQILNVNYPLLASGRPFGVVWARASRHGGFSMTYEPGEAGAVISGMAHNLDGQAESITDTGRFAAGYVTLSVLTPDWNADPSAAAAVRARVADVESLLAP
ncbi:MAG: 5'/3'-nucleotidase SurE [Verrucomicrobiota bacterium]